MLLIKIACISLLSFMAGIMEGFIQEITGINISRFIYIMLGIFICLIWKVSKYEYMELARCKNARIKTTI